MPIQQPRRRHPHHDINVTYINLSDILTKASQHLTDAHIAYAEHRFSAQHYQDTYAVRDAMISLLATIEDGDGYRAFANTEGQDMCQTMRHFEQAACGLIAAIHRTDDVRGTFEPEAARSWQ